MRYADDWKLELQTGLSEVVDRAVVAGARAEQVFEALFEELQAMKNAWQHDPEPADDDLDVLDEPANDWPAADRGF
ncbi:hypothetical protein EON80_13355 [bacterium]|nr:MAG: hypothetical protein EON80_13355 [bacterium]